METPLSGWVVWLVPKDRLPHHWTINNRLDVNFKCYKNHFAQHSLHSFPNRYRLALPFALIWDRNKRNGLKKERNQKRKKKEKKESQSISGKLMSDLRNVTNLPANGEQINLIKCHFFHRTPVFRTHTSTQSQALLPLPQSPNIFISAIDRSAINKKLQKYCATTPWCGANGDAQLWIVACFGCGFLFESVFSLRVWLSYIKADTY